MDSHCFVTVSKDKCSTLLAAFFLQKSYKLSSSTNCFIADAKLCVLLFSTNKPLKPSLISSLGPDLQSTEITGVPKANDSTIDKGNPSWRLVRIVNLAC